MTSRERLKHITFLRMCYELAALGTCVRRKVACLFIDEDGFIAGSGYNGSAHGQPHCIEHPCEAATAPSGTALTACEAVHAEMNAYGQCRDIRAIRAIYCTTAPCGDCIKPLLQTSAQQLVFMQDYPGSELSRARWTAKPSARSGQFREWIMLTPEECGYTAEDMLRLDRRRVV